jgi:predicted lipoprotein
MRRVSIAFALGLSFVTPASPQDSAATADFNQSAAKTRLIDQMLEAVITPNFAALETRTSALSENVALYCDDPSVDRLSTVAASLEETATAWAHVRALGIEPMVAEYRDARFFFWPDPLGLTVKKVQQAIVERDEDLIAPATLREKSVTLQGLGALEFALFGPSPANDDEQVFRCRYATALAQGLVGMAHEMAVQTAPSGTFAELFGNPGVNNLLYGNSNEAIRVILTAAAFSVDIARDRYILPVLSETADLARPRIAPLWRTGASLAFLKGLIDASRQIFEDADLAMILPPDTRSVADSIETEFAAAIAAMPAADQAIELAASDEDFRASLFQVALHLGNLQSLFAVSVPEAAGFAWFSFVDGDSG